MVVKTRLLGMKYTPLYATSIFSYVVVAKLLIEKGIYGACMIAGTNLLSQTTRIQTIAA
jgi:hypothetical protein